MNESVSGFLHKAGFQHDVAEVGFAVEFVITLNNTDALDLGANLHRAGRAFELQILDQYDAVAIAENITVGVFNDARAILFISFCHT